MRSRLASLSGAVAVLITGWILALPSWHGWFKDDDFTNMRWVQEYRNHPWAAILERHAVHDHIRPFNLIFHWIGGQLSNGDWWGPHAVLVLLALGGLASTMGLAARRHGPAAAPIAGLLGLPVGGLGLLLGWNAWIGSAGEVASGITAVLLAYVAIEKRSVRYALGALVFEVSAGFFKEPGWIAYPLAIAAMALPALIRKETDRRVALLLLGAPLIGALGFAFSWSPTNVTRTLGASVPLSQRIVEALRCYGTTLVNTWPLVPSAGGISAPLLALAFWREWIPPMGRARGPILVILALATAGAAVVFSKHVGIAMIVAMALVLLRNATRPQPELVFGLATIGVMMFNQGPDPVHALAAGWGLAVWTSGHLVAMGREGRGRLASTRGKLAYGAAIVVLAILPVVHVKHAILRAPRPQGDDDLRFRLTALSGLAQLLKPVTAQAEPDAFSLAPMMGLPNAMRTSDAAIVNVNVPGLARLTVPREAAQKTLLERNAMPVGMRTVRSVPATDEVDVTGGPYAVGIAGQSLRDAQIRMTVTDACRHSWSAAVPGDSDWASLAVMTVRSTCAPLKVSIDGPDAPRAEAFLLVPLPAARYELRAMADRADHVDVKPRSVPVSVTGPKPK